MVIQLSRKSSRNFFLRISFVSNDAPQEQQQTFPDDLPGVGGHVFVVLDLCRLVRLDPSQGTMEVALFVASLSDDTGNDGIDGNRRGDKETGRIHQHQAARDDCEFGIFPLAGGSLGHLPQQEPVRATPLHLGAREDRDRHRGVHGGSPPGGGRRLASRFWNRQDEPNDSQDPQGIFENPDGVCVGKQSLRSVRNEVGTPDGVALVRCPPFGIVAHDASLELGQGQGQGLVRDCSTTDMIRTLTLTLTDTAKTTTTIRYCVEDGTAQFAKE